MSDKPNVEKGVDVRATDGTTRAPYRPPALIQLGSIRNLTLAVSTSGNADGGMMSNTRTGRGGRFDADGRPL